MILKGITREERLAEIKAMSHEELARFWRFGDWIRPYDNIKEECDLLYTRLFIEMKGFTPELSKKIGWE